LTFGARRTRKLRLLWPQGRGGAGLPAGAARPLTRLRRGTAPAAPLAAGRLAARHFFEEDD
jgi:hypothetical protein